MMSATQVEAFRDSARAPTDSSSNFQVLEHSIDNELDYGSREAVGSPALLLVAHEQRGASI